MTNLEFVLLFSIMPAGALVIAGVLLYVTRADRRNGRHAPGE